MQTTTRADAPNAPNTPDAPDAPAVEATAPANVALRGKPLWRSLVELLIAIGVGVFLAQAFFAWSTVDGDAMTPTLRPGQLVLVSRAPYVLTVPQRGDVVAVRSRIDPNKIVFYRVTGVPGDQLNVKGGQLTVNDQPLVEPYLPETTTRVEVTSNTIGQYRIGPDEYFLMNDNRDNVDDSRTSGVFTRADLVGRTWMVVWPPDSLRPIGHLRPILGQ